VTERFDVLAFGAHPDDLEVAMGGTAAKLSDKGLKTLFVDLCDGEPTRHANRGTRNVQAIEAARILGVSRLTLNFQDRLIADRWKHVLPLHGSSGCIVPVVCLRPRDREFIRITEP
jgi:LmbE family N-acetylglucosaminyl deacetylase